MLKLKMIVLLLISMILMGCQPTQKDIEKKGQQEKQTIYDNLRKNFQ